METPFTQRNGVLLGVDESDPSDDFVCLSDRRRHPHTNQDAVRLARHQAGGQACGKIPSFQQMRPQLARRQSSPTSTASRAMDDSLLLR